MILKLLWLALLLTGACRLITGRWPWRLFGKSASGRGGAADEARLRAQTLLGVSPDASREDIIDAHRALIARVHPDRGGTSALVHEANAARDLLLGRLPPSDKDPS